MDFRATPTHGRCTVKVGMRGKTKAFLEMEAEEYLKAKISGGPPFASHILRKWSLWGCISKWELSKSSAVGEQIRT